MFMSLISIWGWGLGFYWSELWGHLTVGFWGLGVWRNKDLIIQK